MNILKTVGDRAISSEFLTRRVVQEYSIQRGKISIFATFGGHLGFQRKMKKCEYLENRSVGQECPIQKGKIFNFRHFGRPSWILAENEKV